jgi:hypothetical protein
MDKKAVALSTLSALLLASASGGDAEAQLQKSTTPSTNVPKMVTAPPAPIAGQKVPPSSATTLGAIQTQRSKSINAASPAAVSKLNRIQADHDSGWIEHFTNGHTSASNPIGNVQKTLKSQ